MKSDCQGHGGRFFACEKYSPLDINGFTHKLSSALQTIYCVQPCHAASGKKEGGKYLVNDISVEDVVESLLEKYKGKISHPMYEELGKDLTALTMSVFTVVSEGIKPDRILIHINPQKVDAELLIQMSDDWVDYVIGELGLNPSDAVMITPI